MKATDLKKTACIVSICLLIAIVAIGFLANFNNIKPLFFSILIAVLLTYLINPIILFLQRYMSRICAIILFFTLITVFIVISLLFIFPRISQEVNKLITLLPEYSDRITGLISQYQIMFDSLKLPETFRSTLLAGISKGELYVNNLIDKIMNGIINLLSNIVYVAIVPVLVFYFLKDMEYFKKMLIHFIPKKYQHDVIAVVRNIGRELGLFIRGQATVSLIVGILITIGLFIINLEYALILGIISGIFDLVPYFGPIFGSIPIVIIALLENPNNIVYALGVVVVVQQLESSIITPKIIGDSVGLHPVYIIISILLGGIYFGVFGILFAVPIVLVLRIIIKYLIGKIV
ncbi:MAG TPA: AI-2E family transporter [Clostridiales bacterium]|nr:AI-2E family transporter [Clostridiales bacterium]